MSVYPIMKTATTGVLYPIMPLLLCLMITTTVDAQTTVDTTGWSPNDGKAPEEQKGWLEQHGRIAMVVVIGAFIVALVIWYIVRSVRGMRQRLKQENENQLYAIQQMTASRQPQPINPTAPTQRPVEPKSSFPQRY